MPSVFKKNQSGQSYVRMVAEPRWAGVARAYCKIWTGEEPPEMKEYRVGAREDSPVQATFYVQAWEVEDDREEFLHEVPPRLAGVTALGIPSLTNAVREGIREEISRLEEEFPTARVVQDPNMSWDFSS